MWDMALNKRPNRYIRSLCAYMLKTVQNYSPQRLETNSFLFFFDWCLTETMRGYTWKWTSWVVQARSQTVKALKYTRTLHPSPYMALVGHIPDTSRYHHHEAMLVPAWPAFSNTDESTEWPDGGDRALQHAMQLRDGSFLNFHCLFGWLRQCHDDTKRWCSSYCYCSCTSGWMFFFLFISGIPQVSATKYGKDTHLSWIGFRRTCSDKNSVTSWFNMIEGGLLLPWCRSCSSYCSAVAVGKYWHLCEASIILTTASGSFCVL